MKWTIWILFSAVFLAFYDIAKKASVNKNAVMPTLLCSTCFGSVAFLLTIFFTTGLNTFDDITPKILFFGASKSVIVATSWIFTFCALRELPISIATPIRASAPALVFLLATFLYDEKPHLLQGIGMLIVFAGYFVFSWAGKHEGINFFKNRAVYLAIAGAVCSAISAVWDKYVFQVCNAPIEKVQLLFQLGLVIFYGLALLIQHSFKWNHIKFEWRWSIPCVGILLAFADWLYFHGIAIPETPISVASLLRRFSVVITFLVGAKFFHETNLLRKGLALLAILTGITLLAISH